MEIHFYLAGSVVPAHYDYAMDVDGVLWPSTRPNKGASGKMYVVLEKVVEAPTRGQRMTIQTIRTINPDWPLHFYFPYE